MNAVTYTELRRDLKRCLDEVSDAREPIRIVRRSGRSAVLVDEEDFASLLETAYLLRSPANAERLDEALQQAERGEIESVDARALLDESGA